MSPKWAKSRFLHEKLMKILKINANLSFFKVLKITTYRKIVKAPPPLTSRPELWDYTLKYRNAQEAFAVKTGGAADLARFLRIFEM